MTKNLKKGISLLLTLAMVFSLCVGMSSVALAVDEIGIKATLDQDTIYTSDVDQTVVLTVAPESTITLSNYDFVVSNTGNFAVASVSNDDPGVNANKAWSANEFNASKNWVIWADDLADDQSVAKLVDITYTIPANTAPGTYTFSISEMNAGKTFGLVEVWTAATTASATLTIASSDVASTEAVLSQTDAEVTAGETVSLTASLLPSDTTETIDSIVWSSSSDAIASVTGDENGATVTGVAAGSATITADITTSAGTSYSLTCAVTVKADPTVVEKFDLSGANMTLGSSLAMNFFIDPSNLAEGESYYAVITKTDADGREATVTIPQSDWSVLEESNLYYVTFNGVAAKEMTDEITVVIYNSADEAVSNEWVDSVRAYTMRALDNETAAAKLALYVDMLNYGAAAQSYFDGYHGDALANGLLSDAQKAYATAIVTTEDNRVVGGNGYCGTSLTLESEIILNFFFDSDVVAPDMYAVASFTDHYGNVKDIRIEGSDFGQIASDSKEYLYVPVTGLAVADGSTLVTVTVYTADGTEVTSVQDSVESYVNRGDAANPLYENIMKFATSAYAYFHA